MIYNQKNLHLGRHMDAYHIEMLFIYNIKLNNLIAFVDVESLKCILGNFVKYFRKKCIFIENYRGGSGVR